MVWHYRGYYIQLAGGGKLGGLPTACPNPLGLKTEGLS